MEEVLENSWKLVQEYYENHWLNSERSLQAILFHAIIRSEIPSDWRIFVEPMLGDGLVPDLVVLSPTSVKAIIEIKCMPHWWLERSKLNKDLEKLVYYSKQQHFEKDFFGPERVFDAHNKKWIDGKPLLSIDKDPVFAMVAITRDDSISADIKKIRDSYPDISKINNFVLMTGSVSPDIENNRNKHVFRVDKLAMLNGR